jgi:hypothetical protein
MHHRDSDGTARIPAGDRWLIIVVATGAALRFVPVWFGLPYMARPDEEVAIGIATLILDGKLNPEFFHWPSLTFYVLAGVFGIARILRGLVGLEPALTPEQTVVLGRAVMATAGTVTILVLHRIGRRVAGEPAGVIAAGLLAVAMLHVRDSHFAMTDVLMTLLVTTSVALLLGAMDRASEPGAWRWFGAAGLAGGLAAATKYNAAAVAAAMAAAQILLLRDSRHAAGQLRAWRPSFAFALCFAAGFLVATPYAVFDARTFWVDLQFNFTHLSGGHGVDLGRGWTSHLLRSLPYGLGPTTFATALAGSAVLATRHPREAFMLGSFVAALYISIGSGQTVFFRYILPIVPVLCVPAAVAIVHAASWLAARGAMTRSNALAVLLVLTAGPGLVNSVWFDVLLARTDSRVLAARWLQQRVQPGDSVYDSGGTYASLVLREAPRYHAWHFDPELGSFGHPEGRNPDWLVLHESPVSAYASTPPQVRALALRDYELVHRVRATRGRARAAVYDRQDAFFMPLWGFWTVERPGPTIGIYRRVPGS